MPRPTSARAAASSSGSGVLAPRDMLATAGRAALAATQSMPASSEAVEPVPSQAMHRTARQGQMFTQYRCSCMALAGQGRTCPQRDVLGHTKCETAHDARHVCSVAVAIVRVVVTE